MDVVVAEVVIVDIVVDLDCWSDFCLVIMQVSLCDGDTQFVRIGLGGIRSHGGPRADVCE